MLSVQNVAVAFGGTYLFKDISFRLGAGDRVGLVGKNGAGKSTMLNLIGQTNSPTEGSLALEKNLKIGFLKQDIDFVKGRTVLEESYQAFDEIKALERSLEKINTRFSRKRRLRLGILS